MCGRCSTPPSASSACPMRLRSDNGPPFASSGAGGLSRLAVQVIKAGRAAGAHRARQAAAERPAGAAAPDAAAGHRRARRREPARSSSSASAPSSASTTRSARTQRSATRRRRSTTRPRRGAGTACCASPTTPPTRGPAGAPNGEIKWRGKLVHINDALAGEPVGLAETEDGAWRVCYGPLALGLIDHRGERLKKPRKRLWTCGQRCALPTGSTAATATATGTEREMCHRCRRSDLSPMFPVAHSAATRAPTPGFEASGEICAPLALRAGAPGDGPAGCPLDTRLCPAATRGPLACGGRGCYLT